MQLSNSLNFFTALKLSLTEALKLCLTKTQKLSLAKAWTMLYEGPKPIPNPDTVPNWSHNNVLYTLSCHKITSWYYYKGPDNVPKKVTEVHLTNSLNYPLLRPWSYLWGPNTVPN